MGKHERIKCSADSLSEAWAAKAWAVAAAKMWTPQSFTRCSGSRRTPLGPRSRRLTASSRSSIILTRAATLTPSRRSPRPMISLGTRRSVPSTINSEGKDEVHPLEVSLEDLYNGKVRKLSVTRQVIDRSVPVKTCEECDGQGVVIQMIRMGPMVQQTQSACSSCNGKGVTCKKKRVKEVLEVPVQKGAPSGHRVTFQEKSDEHLGVTPGDVIFVLNETPHAVFKRRGADLYVEKTISLVEALCGFEMEVEHLDGRTLIVKSNPGDVIAPCLYDPFAEESDELQWERIENMNVTLEDVARAETDDVEALKNACGKGQLRGKGIGCFITL